jgi:hypothetical protein
VEAVPRFSSGSGEDEAPRSGLRLAATGATSEKWPPREGCHDVVDVTMDEIDLTLVARIGGGAAMWSVIKGLIYMLSRGHNNVTS